MFKRVPNFKYLGVIFTNKQIPTINSRITAGIKYYFMLEPLFKWKLLSKNMELRLYKVLFRPIVLYACGAWASKKSDEKKLIIFERKCYDLKRNGEENTYE